MKVYDAPELRKSIELAKSALREKLEREKEVTTDANYNPCDDCQKKCCGDCFYHQLAVDEVRRRNPQPLTLDELRKMDGEPVWTVGVSFTKDGTWSMWDIVESADDDGIEFGYSTESKEWWNYNLRNTDGTPCGCAWVCYRLPLNGQEPGRNV